jgi:hypothetical protein
LDAACIGSSNKKARFPFDCIPQGAAIGRFAEEPRLTSKVHAWFYPTINCDLSTGDVEVRGISSSSELTAIEAKRLSNLTQAKSKAISISGGDVVPILNVCAITLARPPAHHVSRRRGAGSALARAAGIENRLNLKGSKRVVENFNFVEAPLKEVVAESRDVSELQVLTVR